MTDHDAGETVGKPAILWKHRVNDKIMTGRTMIGLLRSTLFILSCVASLLSCAASLAAGTSPLSAAEIYPNRPVHWMIGFAPGGPVDIVARIMAQWLSDHFGPQFIVENRAGMGGNIATAAAIAAAPDGYTLLFSGANNAISASLYKKLSFDFLRDTTPVASFIGAPELLSALTDITSFSSGRVTTYCVLLVFYMAVVMGVVWLCNRLRSFLEHNAATA